MRKLVLISVCVLGLAVAGNARTQAPAKKEAPKKEVAAPAKKESVAKAANAGTATKTITAKAKKK
jgi:hypothetical protein